MHPPTRPRRRAPWRALGSLACLTVALFTACTPPAAKPPVAGAARVPADPTTVFHAGKLAEIDVTLGRAIAEKRCPGGVFWLEREGVAYHKPYGQRALEPAAEPMTEDTIFDLASLTKVIATTPAILRLVERGQIVLDAPVATYLPEFGGQGKASITVRQLLTHTSGLRPGLGARPAWEGVAKAIEFACGETPTTRPGTAFRYSDINFIVLGELVGRVAGVPLDQFVAREVFAPLQMRDTGFRPGPALRPRIAPTEVVNGRPLRGEVHDPTARRMGGVAGHAGLFSTAADLARFARMMLRGGELEGVRVLARETVTLMTSIHTPVGVAQRRGLGWDIDSSYAGPRGAWFPVGSYGHTGWTGTSLWLDPFSQTFVLFLSNRNHPDESGSVIALRRQLGTLAAEAVIGFNFAFVPGALTRATNEAVAVTLRTAQVLNGIDVLAKQDYAPLKGLRVGLITNHTGQDRQRRPTIDLLRAAPAVTLVRLFSPEHGIRGALDEKIADSVDEPTGLPVISLYGETRQPKPEHLEGLDALVFDVQDIGCRFYTYISTMRLAMEAAASARLKFIVLDRVNPIGGTAVEGPILVGEPSFVATHPIPLRHGLTVGELARLIHAERALACDLRVIPVEGWTREMWFDQTSLPWSHPSPNMRSLTAATFYPGVGLLESALSVGRGTGTPFEIVGAPYIDDVKLAAELNRAGLTGVRFVPVRFTPTASTFKDQPCGGVSLLLTQREVCNAVDVGLTLALVLQRLYPKDFALDKLTPLLRHPATLEAMRSGQRLADLKAAWDPALEDFKTRRAAFLLYP